MNELINVQREWLVSCLKRNAACDYGGRFGFDGIVSVKAYQEQVPLCRYEEIAPYVERIAAGEADLLFSGLPVAFEMTGGTSGGSKLVPYTQESFSDFQRAILPWFGEAAAQYGIGGGFSYWAISPVSRRPERTPGGVAIGVSDAAYFGEASGTVTHTSAVPEWVGTLRDTAQWQLITLYWLLRCEALELVSVWSPTFFLALLDALDTRGDELESLFENGGRIAQRELAADSDALWRFRRYGHEGKTDALWPHLKLVSCWGDASSAPFYERLRQRLSHAAFQPKGIICTEGALSVPDAEGRALLCASSGFFEFIDERGAIRLAHELASGAAYEVVMTTSGGLYRYRTGDMVRCEGYANGLPHLRFLGRSGIVSDMVGEKLTEAFAATALQGLGGFAMLLPVAQAEEGYYLLLTDALADDGVLERIERRLGSNPQYAYARKMGQLGALKNLVAADAMTLYLDYKSRDGGRVGDIKIPALQCDGQWLQLIQRKAR